MLIPEIPAPTTTTSNDSTRDPPELMMPGKSFTTPLPVCRCLGTAVQ